MSKDETLTYIDRAIEQYQIGVHYNEAVNAIRSMPGGGFVVKWHFDERMTLGFRKLFDKITLEYLDDDSVT